MIALEKLKIKNQENKFICVGLDPDPGKIPDHIMKSGGADHLKVLSFNREIINSTSDIAAAYKLNFAFYEIFGSQGFELLKNTIELIPKDKLIIADAKRGDIGNTAAFYAKSIYDQFGFDSATLNPFMGEDSISPFLEYREKLNFILVLTSNPGANDFEKLELKNGMKLFQAVCRKVNDWNKSGNCGIVFGATQQVELKDNFSMFSGLPVLLPGVGSQGGDLEKIVSFFKEKNKIDFLINVSRGILYKSKDEDFAGAARNELLLLNNKVAASFSS